MILRHIENDSTGGRHNSSTKAGSNEVLDELVEKEDARWCRWSSKPESLPYLTEHQFFDETPS